jgi:hypothetical protein
MHDLVANSDETQALPPLVDGLEGELVVFGTLRNLVSDNSFCKSMHQLQSGIQLSHTVPPFL